DRGRLFKYLLAQPLREVEGGWDVVMRTSPDRILQPDAFLLERQGVIGQRRRGRYVLRGYGRPIDRSGQLPEVGGLEDLLQRCVRSQGEVGLCDHSHRGDGAAAHFEEVGVGSDGWEVEDVLPDFAQGAFGPG